MANPGSEWRTAYSRRARDWWTAERLRELDQGRQRRLSPDRAPCLLRAMGVLDAHGRMSPGRVKKYRQINHLLGFLIPALEELVEDGSDPLVVVDAGCGRSALGFLVAWWLADRGAPGRIVGIDSNPDVIAGCIDRAQIAGLEMAFVCADLATLDVHATLEAELGAGHLDALLALHACDTATDHALAIAVHSGTRFFAVAPCCQAELSRAWADLDPPPLGSLHSNPHLRRTLAATVTDAMRAELMRDAGYDVRVTEFVEAHHTPKNTLIYGHRHEKPRRESGYSALVERTGGTGISLATLLGSPQATLAPRK